jgi:hypothetical protein
MYSTQSQHNHNNIMAPLTTKDIKEQLQEDIITLCFSYNPQISEDLISELCEVVAEWDQELFD